MSMDREALQEYLSHLTYKYYGYEIVERLENAGILTVSDVIAYLEDFIIEGKSVLDE